MLQTGGQAGGLNGGPEAPLGGQRAAGCRDGWPQSHPPSSLLPERPSGPAQGRPGARAESGRLCLARGAARARQIVAARARRIVAPMRRGWQFKVSPGNGAQPGGRGVGGALERLPGCGAGLREAASPQQPCRRASPEQPRARPGHRTAAVAHSLGPAAGRWEHPSPRGTDQGPRAALLGLQTGPPGQLAGRPPLGRRGPAPPELPQPRDCG